MNQFNPKILIAASECVPFIKTGGLADVIGALPKELKKLGADVRVILPLYSPVKRKFGEGMEKLCEFYVKLGWRSQYCGIYTMEYEGVTFYFVDNEYYFARGYIYGNSSNDEGERFGFYSKAVLECLPHIGFYPDVLHAHDWQAAMTISLLRQQYYDKPEYARIRTMYTIHNLRYQGIFEWPFMDELFRIGSWDFHDGTYEYYGKMNFTKGALNMADIITTVSPTYAQEIRTPAYGETLDGVLRRRENVVYGIMNGIDEPLFDPETDPALPAHYSIEDISGKAICKAELQKELGLEQRPDVPVIGIVTRFTNQKGLDLVEYALEFLMERDVQLAVLGSGDARYEHLFGWGSWRYNGKVGARLTYDPKLANRIYAGADMFLMPSQFEPCGLAQLIALRYGNIPIVRETGGLKDSIIPYNKYTGEGLGFTFSNYEHWDMLGAIDRALEAYADPEAWRALVKQGMEAHFTWDASAQRYMELYAAAMGK